jgi:NADH-quinone oxidoreductase subunit M
MMQPSLLLWILAILLLGSAAAWTSEKFGQSWPRWISLFALAAQMGLVIALRVHHAQMIDPVGGTPWILEYRSAWIPSFGISLSLGMDGISLLLIILSDFLGIAAVLASWNSIRKSIGFFHFNLLISIFAFVLLFLALDLFLFYFAYEVMLVPLYFLIAIWGYEKRRAYAAIKFFIFTQLSGLLMLISILGLYFAHIHATGIRTFSYHDLIGTPMSSGTSFLLMLGFFAAFSVKLPVVPFHSWLPDAHTEGPTAASVYLAGLVLKVGAYGFLRLLIPLFPKAASDFAIVAMILGIISIFYGAILSFGQQDLKRMVAYSSVSHMGFVIMGLFAWNQLSLQGALMIMLAHGISTGGLFILVGDLYERTHTRDLNQLGGLWSHIPNMGGAGMILVMATLGLPGLGNFVGEFLVLLGLFRFSIPLAAVATFGFVVATIYSLAIIQKVFHGPIKSGQERKWHLYDMTPREYIVMFLMIGSLLWLGLYPQQELNTARRALENMQQLSKLP